MSISNRMTRVRAVLLCCFLWPHVFSSVVRPDTPIMGFSTWNGFHSDISDSVIREVADAIVKTGLRDLGYTYVNLDDAWAAYDRNASGHIVAHAVKFPNGMRSLSDHLHAQGFKFGLYTARWNRTCGGQMPGSLGYEPVDAATFADYGADFIKNDDCHVVYGDAVKDYGAMQKAIAAVDRPMLHTVKAPDLPAANASTVCQFRRVGKDIKNSWEDMVRTLDYGYDEAYNELIGPGKGFFQDYDMLEVGSSDGNTHGSPRLTLSEQQAHFSLWAAVKSPLILGNDPRNMSAETLDILKNKEVIAVNQDSLATPARLVKSSHAATSPNDGTKATLRPCIDGDKSQSWILERTTASVAGRIRSASDPSLCLGLWKCQKRWPWWLAAQRCDTDTADADSMGCTAADQMSWAWNSSVGSIEWSPTSSSLASCWGSPGRGCCMSTEGGNPELDTCGWPTDPSQQEWRFADLDGATRVVSARRGLCLTLIDDLEIYAGPLSGGRATAVLFNRSPRTANISLDFADIPGFAAEKGGKVAVRDLWSHQDLGMYRDAFVARVESHGIIHVNLAVAELRGALEASAAVVV